MNTILLLAAVLGLVLLAITTFDVFSKKFLQGKQEVVVCNKATDDGENITIQFAIKAGLTPEQKFEAINLGIKPLESRMAFTQERFKELLEKERAKQDEERKLKSV